MALVLTRRKLELLKIGPDITVTVVRISAGTVRLAIDAPPDVRIVRGELAEKNTHTENQSEGTDRQGAAA